MAREKTFIDFMSVCEAVSQSDKKLAQSGVISRHADALQREIDAATSGKTKPVTKSASRKVTKQSYEVREENDTQAPPTKEEKRKIKLMQQLERLKREKSASRIQSDVAREEYEIDEANKGEAHSKTSNWDKVYDRTQRDNPTPKGTSHQSAYKERKPSGDWETGNQTTKRLSKQRVQAHRDVRGVKRVPGAKGAMFSAGRGV